LGGLALGLAFDEVGVRGEIIKAPAFENRQVFRKLCRAMNESRLVAHGLDALVTGFHYAGADLHRVRAKQDELRGVVAGFECRPGRKGRLPGNSFRMSVAISMIIRSAMGLTALDE